MTISRFALTGALDTVLLQKISNPWIDPAMALREIAGTYGVVTPMPSCG